MKDFLVILISSIINYKRKKKKNKRKTTIASHIENDAFNYRNFNPSLWLDCKEKKGKLKEKVKKKKLSFLIWKSENFLFVLKNKGESKFKFC